MTIVLGIFALEPGQKQVECLPKVSAIADFDPVPLSPLLSGWNKRGSAPSCEVVGTGACLLQILDRPMVWFTSNGRGGIGERSKEADARLAGAVVLGPGSRRSQVNNSGPGQESPECGGDETRSVVALEHERRLVATEKPPHCDGDFLGRASGKGNPRDRVAGGQITNGQNESPYAVHWSGRLRQVDGPDGTGPLPGELIEPRPSAPSMAEAVLAEMSFERAPGCPWHECPKRGHADVRAHGLEEIVGECDRVRV
jgi:hypothetical protein